MVNSRHCRANFVRIQIGFFPIFRFLSPFFLPFYNLDRKLENEKRSDLEPDGIRTFASFLGSGRAVLCRGAPCCDGSLWPRDDRWMGCKRLNVGKYGHSANRLQRPTLGQRRPFARWLLWTLVRLAFGPRLLAVLWGEERR